MTDDDTVSTFGNVTLSGMAHSTPHTISHDISSISNQTMSSRVSTLEGSIGLLSSDMNDLKNLLTSYVKEKSLTADATRQQQEFE